MYILGVFVMVCIKVVLSWRVARSFALRWCGARCIFCAALSGSGAAKRFSACEVTRACPKGRAAGGCAATAGNLRQGNG